MFCKTIDIIIHLSYGYKYRFIGPNYKEKGYYILIFVPIVLYLCQANHMLKQDRTIIHVEVKDTHEHFYFGSAAAMFEDSRVKNLLGIAYQTFRKRRVGENNPYENEFVIVRKGKLNTILHGEEIQKYLL